MQTSSPAAPSRSSMTVAASRTGTDSGSGWSMFTVAMAATLGQRSETRPASCSALVGGAVDVDDATTRGL